MWTHCATNHFSLLATYILFVFLVVSPHNGKGKAAPHPAPASPGPELAVPSKRPRQSNPGPSTNASILSSLLEVKSALSVMNARLNSLEPAMPCKQPGPFFLGLGMPAPAVPTLHADITPQRSLGTAVPAPSMGSQFLPPAAAIPDSLRAHILSGIGFFFWPVYSCPA